MRGWRGGRGTEGGVGGEGGCSGESAFCHSRHSQNTNLHISLTCPLFSLSSLSFLSFPSPSFPRFRLAISTTVSGGDFSARPILSLPRIQSQHNPSSLPHLRGALGLISASVHSDLWAAPTVTIKEVSRRKPEMQLCGNRETIPGLGSLSSPLQTERGRDGGEAPEAPPSFPPLPCHPKGQK